MRRLSFALTLSLGSLMLAGCEFDPTDWGNSDRYREEFASQHKLAPGGRVMLESFNGSVEIVGWEKDAVDISGVKYASREEVMHDIKIDVVPEAESIRIRAIRPIDHNCNCGAKFVLKVPKRANLDNITTSNASIRIDSVNGNARLKTSNGSVNVWNVEGELEATTSNASIEIGKFKGPAELRTSNGRIKAEGMEGAFNAKTSNSSIDATISSLQADRRTVLESSNGSINLTLDKWNKNEVRATTSNSSINVRIPEDIHADLRATTSNGHITSDLAVTSNQFSKTRLAGQIGGGGPLLELVTTNGNIRLMKR